MYLQGIRTVHEGIEHRWLSAASVAASDDDRAVAARFEALEYQLADANQVGEVEFEPVELVGILDVDRVKEGVAARGGLEEEGYVIILSNLLDWFALLNF